MRSRTALAKAAERPGRNALLLRVGIDRGTGGALSPIFGDGSFEYIPIPEAEPTRSPFTFATLPTRRASSLAALLPPRIASLAPHVDPDFTSFAYGDAAPRKRNQLLRLGPGDLLVFYSGLMPWPIEDIPRLFTIGWFEVRQVHNLTAHDISTNEKLNSRFGNTAHFLRRVPDRHLTLVEGNPRNSAILERALPLGDGHDRLLCDLAFFGYQGSLQRAVGHWLRGRAVAAVERWLREGPASVIDDDTRIFCASADDLRPGPPGCCRGDLLLTDRRLEVGDWAYASASKNGSTTFALARVNRVGETWTGGPARASLFWYLMNLAPSAVAQIPIPGQRHFHCSGAAAIRHLVSWTWARYRVGIHSAAAQGSRVGRVVRSRRQSVRQLSPHQDCVGAMSGSKALRGHHPKMLK